MPEKEEPEIHLVNLSLTRKPVVDFGGMIVVGANVEEFPELQELAGDTDGSGPVDPDD